MVRDSSYPQSYPQATLVIIINLLISQLGVDQRIYINYVSQIVNLVCLLTLALKVETRTNYG